MLVVWPCSSDRFRCLLRSTISWALRLAGLASFPAKPHTDATATAMHSTLRRFILSSQG